MMIINSLQKVHIHFLNFKIHLIEINLNFLYLGNKVPTRLPSLQSKCHKCQ